MTYAEAIDWLYARQDAGIKLGLDNIRRLLDALGLPDSRMRIVHVAGTNGKGSTCALAESTLRAAGYTTGLFTSPHLVSFCERVRIDGQPISEDEAARHIGALRDLTDDWDQRPTFFEFATALAILAFDEHGVDAAVVEVGLGGRLDSTNALTPSVCAIAQIALDHRHILGDTLGQIAGEKAGILKPGVPAVSAPQADEAREAIAGRAAEIGAPLDFVDAPWTTSELSLAGEHQRWNAALAVAALRAGGFDVDDEAIERGLASARWRGRFEQIQLEDGTSLIVDGAHNPAAARALATTWGELYADQAPTIILSAAANKDLPDMIAPLAELAAGFVLTRADSPRVADTATLAALLPEGMPHETAPTAAGALTIARRKGRPILAAGSLFLAGEILSLVDQMREKFEPSDQ